MIGRIDQLLHGYRRGHEQLAGSIRLPPKDAELVARLSDLSGTLVGGPEFDPYLTAYPLPGGLHFAVAMTWPDLLAPRSGCVLTHTLLIPTELWRSLPQPQEAEMLFRNPSGHLPEDIYERPLVWPSESSGSSHRPVGEQSVAASSDFVHRYFARGKRPVVWFGHPNPIGALWCILRALWPNLRTRFAASTFCLQPRTLDDRPFDVMFAPADAYPRFLKVDPEGLLEYSGNQKRSLSESWSNVWAQRVFSSAGGEENLDPDLFNNLDDDPTAIRRLYLIEAAMCTNFETPQEAVGAMDLVESVAREPDIALRMKVKIAKRAVAAAAAAKDLSDSLESLRLVEDRLQRSSFNGVARTIGPLISVAVADRTLHDPEAVVQLTPASRNLAVIDNSSWFARGVLDGFRQLLSRSDPGVAALRAAPAIKSQLFASDASAAVAYLNSLFLRRGESEIRTAIRNELSAMQSRLHGIRCSLIVQLGLEDFELIGELLKGLGGQEVAGVLEALEPLLDDSHMLKVVEPVAREFPEQTRVWGNSTKHWSLEVGKLLACTYAETSLGLEQLLNERMDHARHTKTIAAYLLSLRQDGFPAWTKQIARQDERLFAILLQSEGQHDAVADELLLRLLDECDDLPLAHFPSVLSQLNGLENRAFFRQLLDVCLRDLLRGYLDGSVPEAAVVPILQMPATSEWLRKVSPSDLRSLLTYQVWSQCNNWINAWRLLLLIPDSLVDREWTVLSDVIDALLRARTTSWSPIVAHNWAAIVSRIGSEQGPSHMRLVFAVQALRYAFYNTQLPLSEVVVETFIDVYWAVTSSTNVPEETAPLFGIFDWDKGKELRKYLISAFMNSNWPPGDLALAVKEPVLMRKIFKRIYRKSAGERYLRSMLTDLQSRGSSDANRLGQVLELLLANPNFYEEWD